MEIRYIANRIADITGTRSEKIRPKKSAFSFDDLKDYISGKYGTGIIDIINNSDDIIVLKNGASIKKEKKEKIGENDIIAFAPVIMGG